METIEEAKKDGKILKIFQEEMHDINPREWDNLGTLAIKHREYNIGEEKIEDPIEWLEEKLSLEPKGEYSNERLKELEAEFFKKFIAEEVYMLDHSGLRFSTSGFSCPWDSGKIGYIYTTKEKAKQEGLTYKKAREVLRNEIKTLDELESEGVYGFKIVKPEKIKVEETNLETGKKNQYEQIIEKEIDSCSGFIGGTGIKQIYEEAGFNRETDKIE